MNGYEESKCELAHYCDQWVVRRPYTDKEHTTMIDYTSMESRPTVIIPLYTPAEWLVLNALRDLYQSDHDLFTSEERARLSFLRWLVRTERLTQIGRAHV